MNSQEKSSIQVTTKNFNHEVIDSKIPVVLDFWAPWCGPCKAIGPILEDLASQWAGRVKVAKLNVDEEPELAGAFQVRSIPTIVAMKGRDVVDVQVGFGGQKALAELFDKLVVSI